MDMRLGALEALCGALVAEIEDLRGQVRELARNDTASAPPPAPVGKRRLWPFSAKSDPLPIGALRWPKPPSYSPAKIRPFQRRKRPSFPQEGKGDIIYLYLGQPDIAFLLAT